MSEQSTWKKLIEEVESALIAHRAAGTVFSIPAEGNLALVDDCGKLSALVRTAKGRGIDARAAIVQIIASAAMYVEDIIDESDELTEGVDVDELQDDPDEDVDRIGTLHEDAESEKD